jgi:hypothetical protein
VRHRTRQLWDVINIEQELPVRSTGERIRGMLRNPADNWSPSAKTKSRNGAHTRKDSAEVMCLRYLCRSGEYKNVAVLALDRGKNVLLSHFTEDWSGLDDGELEMFASFSEAVIRP